MKKLTYKYVKRQFELSNWHLIEDTYINSKTPMKCICPNGHLTSKKYNDLQQNKGCASCCNRERITLYKVNRAFEKEGYTAHIDTYINSSTRFECTCDKGHIYTTFWDNFREGKRCPFCYSDNRYGVNCPNYKGGVDKLNVSLYSTYVERLTKYYKVYIIKHSDLELIGIDCHNNNCNTIFNPTPCSIRRRINSINGTLHGANHLYCSQECKNTCSSFAKKKYREGEYINNKNIRTHQTVWANLVKTNANYICEICGKANVVLIGHHEIPVKINPLISADIDNGICLCEDCHTKVHKLPWCTLIYLKDCRHV